MNSSSGVTRLTSTPRPAIEQQVANRAELIAIFKAHVETVVATHALTSEEAQKYVHHTWNQVYHEAYPQEASVNIQGLKADKFSLMFAEGQKYLEPIDAALTEKLKIEPDLQELKNRKALVFGETVKKMIPLDYLPEEASADRTVRLKYDAENVVPYLKGQLRYVSRIRDENERRLKTLQLLSIDLAYSELDGQTIKLPRLAGEGSSLIPYTFKKIVLSHGPILYTATSTEKGAPPFVIYQGTTTNASYPGAYSQIKADLDRRGVGVTVFKENQKLIEYTLKKLVEKTGELPIVVGHSLGGSMATLTGVYCPDLLSEAVGFNGSGFSRKIYNVYESLPKEKQKVKNYGQIDDGVFWAMGRRLIGQTFALLGQERDAKKAHSFPVSLQQNYLIVPLDTKIENASAESSIRNNWGWLSPIITLLNLLITAVIEFKEYFEEPEVRREWLATELWELRRQFVEVKQKRDKAVEAYGPESKEHTKVLEKTREVCGKLRENFDAYRRTFATAGEGMKAIQQSFGDLHEAFDYSLNWFRHEGQPRKTRPSPSAKSGS